MKTALTIAGSDPTGGAGLQIDLKVFKTFDVYGLSVVSAVTAQNTTGVYSVFPVSRELFEKQLHILLSDIRPDAVKIGMIYSRWASEVISKAVKRYSLSNIVIDPVIVSSNGVSLLEDGALDELKDKLFPLSRVITPNIYEASQLTGIMIKNRGDIENAAKILKNMGPEVVVITGGGFNKTVLDLYYDGDFRIIEDVRREGEYHGTGCVFSAAITALLALGHTPFESVKKAKELINNAIERSSYPGKGMGLLNP